MNSLSTTYINCFIGIMLFLLDMHVNHIYTIEGEGAVS